MQPPPVAGPRPVADGFFRWAGANGLVVVDIPQRWTRVENTPIPGMIFAAEDAQTTVGVNIFQYPYLNTPEDAMRAAQKSFSAAGVRLKIASHQQNNGLMVYSGSSISNTAYNKWVGVFRPTDAGVLGFFIGANQKQFDRNQQMIQYIISTARVGP
jgi:hypothetical protein